MLTGGVVSRLSGHDACVRDVSWHPYEDNIISSSVSSLNANSSTVDSKHKCLSCYIVTFNQKSKKNCKRFCYENWSRLLRVLLVRMKWWRFLIPLLMLCLSTVGWSGSNVGAQTDPSSRGGEREGERLTSGERPLGRRKKNKGIWCQRTRHHHKRGKAGPDSGRR